MSMKYGVSEIGCPGIEGDRIIGCQGKRVTG